jgi:hypothetical protein
VVRTGVWDAVVELAVVLVVSGIFEVVVSILIGSWVVLTTIVVGATVLDGLDSLKLWVDLGANVEIFLDVDLIVVVVDVKAPFKVFIISC